MFISVPFMYMIYPGVSSPSFAKLKNRMPVVLFRGVLRNMIPILPAFGLQYRFMQVLDHAKRLDSSCQQSTLHRPYSGLKKEPENSITPCLRNVLKYLQLKDGERENLCEKHWILVMSLLS